MVIEQPIWRVIHPAGGWLFMDLGQQYQDFISDREGNEKPNSKGEYQLYIKGKWALTQNGKVVEIRTVGRDESQEMYFSRIESLASNFPIHSFTAVSLVNNEVVFEAQDGYQLKVHVTGNDDALSLTVVELGSNTIPLTYTHFRFNEELGFLAEIST